MRNAVIKIGGSSYDMIQFGSGEQDLVMIPGLGDGIITVRGKALAGPLLFRQYTKDFRVTMISRNNHLRPDADTRTMARDLAHCMEALEISSAHIVGVSQGGMIAQYLAADYPRKVRKLVLAVTIPAANDLLNENARNWMELARKGCFKDLMIDITEKAHTEAQLKALRLTYPLAGLMAGHPNVERFCIQARSCMTHDAWAELPRIQAPTLIIGGQEDMTLGPEGSRLLHRAIPGSRLILYPSQGHGLYETEKDFHRQVISFLK